MAFIKVFCNDLHMAGNLIKSNLETNKTTTKKHTHKRKLKHGREDNRDYFIKNRYSNKKQQSEWMNRWIDGRMDATTTCLAFNAFKRMWDGWLDWDVWYVRHNNHQKNENLSFKQFCSFYFRFLLKLFSCRLPVDFNGYFSTEYHYIQYTIRMCGWTRRKKNIN